MINYDEMTLTLGPNGGNITSFEVWWMTPFGLAKFEDAKAKLKESDIPLSVLRPVTVVMCDNGLYEVIL